MDFYHYRSTGQQDLAGSTSAHTTGTLRSSRTGLIALIVACSVAIASCSSSTTSIVDNSNITAVLSGTDAFVTGTSDSSLRSVYTRPSDGKQYEQALDMSGRPIGDAKPTSAAKESENSRHFYAESLWYQSLPGSADIAPSVSGFSYDNLEPLWTVELPVGQSCHLVALGSQQELFCVTRDNLYKILPSGQLTEQGTHGLDLDSELDSHAIYTDEAIIVLYEIDTALPNLRTYQWSQLNENSANVQSQGVLSSNAGGGTLDFAALPEAFASDGIALFVAGSEQVPCNPCTEDMAPPATSGHFVARLRLADMALTHRIFYPLNSNLGRELVVIGNLLDIYGEQSTLSLDSITLEQIQSTNIRGEYLNSTQEYLFTGDEGTSTTLIRRYVRGVNDRPAVTPPGTPENLRVEVYSANSLELFWESASSGSPVFTYEIRRNGEVIAIVETNSFFDSTVQAGSYDYTVTAISSEGIRSNPAILPVNVQSPAEDPVQNPVQPQASLDLQIYDGQSLEIFWPRLAEGASVRYEVFRNGELVSVIDGTSYFESGIVNSGNYLYEVFIVAENGESTLIGAATVVSENGALRVESSSSGSAGSGQESTPDGNSNQGGGETDNGETGNDEMGNSGSSSNTPVNPAGNLEVIVYSPNSAELFWAAATSPDGIGQYEIFRNGNLVAVTDGRSYFDANLMAGQSYVYSVVAIDNNGQRLPEARIELSIDPVDDGNGNSGSSGQPDAQPQPDLPSTSPGDDNSIVPALDGPDRDGDGLRNQQDLDDDNDGIPDSIEGAVDNDGDGFLDENSVDTDGDGTPDAWDLDSDNDGILDNIESQNDIAFVLMLDANRNGAIDIGVPTGNNGLADAIETSADSGILANHVYDRDGDGIFDFRDLDSDGDGIFDLIEAGGSDNNADGRIDGFSDSDGKGVDDNVQASALPLFDTDNDGGADFRDPDSDDDSIPDQVESGGSAANPIDSDGDGAPDYREQDSDNDGTPDYTEAGIDRTDPVDSDGNGILDYRDPAIQFSGSPQEGLAPTVPSNLSVNIYSGDSAGTAAEVCWQSSVDPDGDVQVYQVYRDGEPYASITGNCFLDTTVMPGRNYSYTVEAIDFDKQRSPVSQPLMVLIPG